MVRQEGRRNISRRLRDSRAIVRTRTMLRDCGGRWRWRDALAGNTKAMNQINGQQCDCRDANRCPLLVLRNNGMGLLAPLLGPPYIFSLLDTLERRARKLSAKPEHHDTIAEHHRKDDATLFYCNS